MQPRADQYAINRYTNMYVCTSIYLYLHVLYMLVHCMALHGIMREIQKNKGVISSGPYVQCSMNGGYLKTPRVQNPLTQTPKAKNPVHGS